MADERLSRAQERNPFGDVAATSPFVKAIAWAAENKLTNGITETTFAPAQAISRQQFLTILYRYAQFMGYDVSVGEDTNILSSRMWVRLVSMPSRDAVLSAPASDG